VFTGHNSANASVPGEDTFDDWHTYEIDWQPDQLEWIIDGNVMRTLKKADTYNETSKQFQYPQTPSRLQMSLWPAGQSSNAAGTIAWSGGQIDWDSEDIKDPGYYYATIGQVDVQCYSTPDGVKTTGNTSYVYTSAEAMQADVEVTSNTTVLSSLGATGLDPTLGNNTSSSTSSSSDSVPSNSSGGSGNAGSNSTTSGTGSSGTSTESGSASTTSSSFSQGSSSSAANPSDRVLSGSLFAVLVAVGGLVTL
jgi:beta-glucanase (GH16 family)